MYTNRVLVFLVITILVVLTGCSGRLIEQPLVMETIVTNQDGSGINLEITALTGKHHNHPTFSVWIETPEEEYIQTLFVTKSLATGLYRRGQLTDSTWMEGPGVAVRPATLPYWLHKHTFNSSDGSKLPSPGNPVPDAYSGATPENNFQLKTTTDHVIKGKFRILLEVNQPWDWNEHWHNDLHPGNRNYMTSCQPAVVYAVTIDPSSNVREYWLNPIGHSHYAGENGLLYTDLSTLSTALHIFRQVKVTIK
jgi:hypothetical protein